MHTEIRNRALRDAGHHLAQAIQALQDAGYRDLSLDTYDVLNGVLRARRALEQRPAVTVLTPQARTIEVEVR